MEANEILRILRDEQNKVFLVSSHKNMEGDAIGSQLAMAELLYAMGKEVVMLAPEEIADTYKFLPDADKIKFNADGKDVEYDVACIVDCTDLDRLGVVKKNIHFKKPIINIDHHTGNAFFGTINLVDTKASCAGELVYHLFKKAGIPINKKAAMYIYIAMLTDTGSFRYSNTRSQTHEIVAELIKTGLNPTDIYRRIYEGSERSQLMLLSSVLSTLDVTRDKKIAWVKITKAMLKKHKAKMEGTEDFVNFPRGIKGVKIALAFREISRNVVKVSFRSNDLVDIAKLARSFGGGGHPSASGCTLKGSINDIEEAVLYKAKKYLSGGGADNLPCD